MFYVSSSRSSGVHVMQVTSVYPLCMSSHPVMKNYNTVVCGSWRSISVTQDRDTFVQLIG